MIFLLDKIAKGGAHMVQAKPIGRQNENHRASHKQGFVERLRKLLKERHNLFSSASAAMSGNSDAVMHNYMEHRRANK